MAKFTVRLASWPVGEQRTVNAQTIVEAAKRAVTHHGTPKRVRYFDHYAVTFAGYRRSDGSNVNPATVFVKRAPKGATP